MPPRVALASLGHEVNDWGRAGAAPEALTTHHDSPPIDITGGDSQAYNVMKARHTNLQ